MINHAPFKITILLLCALLSCHQERAQLFSKKNTTALRRADPHLKAFTLLDINKAVLEGITSADQAALTLSIPYKEETIVLDLLKVNLFDPSFVVRTDQGNVDYKPGLFYSGTVKGDQGSVVSISVVNGEVSGIISSTKTGDLNIGLSNKVESEYIIYNPQDARDTINFTCGTTEAEPKELQQLKQIQKLRKKAAAVPNRCIGVDFEMTYQSFIRLGSVKASVDWLTAQVSGVKSIYTNEGVEINIRSVYVWTSADGYSTNPSQALSQLSTKRATDPNFKGDLVHLVDVKSSELSGIAFVGTLCFQSYRFAYSALMPTYAKYPAFSWNIEVLTHEMGHNLGSMHTQWCGWPGGPIDGCVTSESGCTNGPLPTKGAGTIMSYCHLNGQVGITFLNGFGKLPGDAIRTHIANASCVGTNCITDPTIPTCTDGIKNQDETGIDCGGTKCPACPVNPSDILISQGKPASQSSQYMPTYPASMIDDGVIGVNNFNHTNAELKPWVEIDLLTVQRVSRVEITNRIGCPTCVLRLKKFRVTVTNFKVLEYPQAGYVYEFNDPTGLKAGITLSVPNLNASGRYIRIWSDNGTIANYLHLSEIKAFGSSIPCVERDTIYRVLRDSLGKVCN